MTRLYASFVSKNPVRRSGSAAAPAHVAIGLRTCCASEQLDRPFVVDGHPHLQLAGFDAEEQKVAAGSAIGVATGACRPTLTLSCARVRHRIKDTEELPLHSKAARFDCPDFAFIVAKIGLAGPFSRISGLPSRSKPVRGGGNAWLGRSTSVLWRFAGRSEQTSDHQHPTQPVTHVCCS